VVTVLDERGDVVEGDQRALVRWVIQGGWGADVVFAAGTTGEWDRLHNSARQRVVQVCSEEVAKENARRGPASGRPVEAWAGVTAPTARETLDNLEFAIFAGADAAVLAPLSISGIEDPVRFVARDVADLLDARERRLPIFLYDNADISAGDVQHLRTRWVKQLSRLDFVRGIKVSAPPRRLGHYTKAARQFRDRGAFGIYVGDAMHILEMMRPHTGFWGALREHWNRFLLHDLLPAGVVSGPANFLPREWQRAWQVAGAGDVERMDELAGIFHAFAASYRFASGKRSLAALKRGLRLRGVLSCDAVARGTPDFTADEGARFDAAIAALLADVDAALPARWRSDPACADEP
jgi:dihydrodipicolinate synthase/N-acetylneuraminate lyase